MRVVGVSATLPNIAHIASFLGANEAHTFDESYRPVSLTTHVIGQGYVGDSSSNQFRFWSSLNQNVPDIVSRFSKQKPTLIFCHSKADTEKLADLLATDRRIGSRTSVNADIATRTRTSKLQRVLYHGIAYHHAGLETDDRRLVEKCFIEGKLRVLCATSTLAMGVNLPAYLVVIKGTKAWRGSGSGYQDLDHATLLQMIGRAGRPGFETEGTAVIMTDNKSKRTFEMLASSGLPPAISKLQSKFDEVINAEVSQEVICSSDSALNWLRDTLFFTQMQHQPSLFGLGHTEVEREVPIACLGTLKRLQNIGAIAQDTRGFLFALPASHLMSQHLVDYATMRIFRDVPFDANQHQVLKSLAAIEGLQQPVRRSEKRFLKEVHKSLKYKLEGAQSRITIQSPSDKAFVLLQISIGRLFLDDYTLRKEMTAMVEFASRMLQALEEYGVRASKHGAVVVESLKLRRALAASMWNGSDGVLNQLMGVGSETTVNLKFAGISKFQDVLEATEEKLEEASNRTSPFGENLRQAVSKILRNTLQLEARIEGSSGESVCVTCEVQRKKFTTLAIDPSTKATSEVVYTLVAYRDGPAGCIMYHRDVSSPGAYKALVPKKFGKVTFHLIASLVGLDGKLGASYKR